MMILFMGFGLRFAGEIHPLVATLLYMFTVTAFGGVDRRGYPQPGGRDQAVATAGFLLVYMLSGLLFPIQNIPVGIRWISNFVWGRYYIEIVRQERAPGGRRLGVGMAQSAGDRSDWLFFLCDGVAQHAANAIGRIKPE